jgi:predicted lipid-binding transport protein (Tim44 family)
MDQPNLIGEKNSLFSTRRPVNAISGLSSGLKSMTKGVVAGTATLIAAPVVGAKTDGVKGFLGGLVTGVIGGAALITSGLVIGILINSFT